jgi:hypothetical protein
MQNEKVRPVLFHETTLGLVFLFVRLSCTECLQHFGHGADFALNKEITVKKLPSRY